MLTPADAVEPVRKCADADVDLKMKVPPGTSDGTGSVAPIAPADPERV
jgi:hypothetical protein